MKREPQLFPYLLLRIASGALNEFQQTELKDTLTIITELHRTLDDLESITQSISDRLYTLIAEAKNSSWRKTLIKIRRDVYNHRSVDYANGEIQASLPLDMQKLLASYTRLQIKISRLHNKGKRTYESEVKINKKAFAKLLRKRDLQNGLLLSSDTINDSLKKYLESNVTHSSILKSERSFMKYLSRMYTKPTPFSTFTNLAIGTLGKGHVLSFVSSTTDTPKKASSHIQLNHRLYLHILELLMQHPEIRKHLPIMPNFTIQRSEQNGFIFLTNSYNRESFQRIAITPALERFYVLTARSDKQWTYQQLVEEIVNKRYIIASEKEVAAYIDQLLEIGFFEFNLGASNINRAWDEKLIKQLSILSNQLPLVKTTLHDIKTLRMLAARYQKAETLRRTQLLTEAHNVFKDTCLSLGATDQSIEKSNQPLDGVFRHTYKTTFNFKPHQLWYEDTRLNEEFILSPDFKEPLRALSDLVSRMEPFDKCHEKRDVMAHFFINTYGDAATISLLQFYRDYSQQVKKGEQTSIKSPFTIEKRTKNKKTLQVFIQLIENQLQSDDIQLNPRHIAHLPTSSSPASFGAFFHAYEKQGKPVLVVNNTTQGYGRMLSRFLYMFDYKVTDALRAWNDQQNDHLLTAEPTDASVFNANLHERLMPNEVVIPGGQSTLSPSAQIHVTDLDVAYNQQQKQLMLIHQKNGKEVQIFNLDLQETTGRSELYNLLSHFTPGSHHHLFHLTNHINQHIKSKMTEDEIVILPRISYDNQIVIQRKAWQVPKDLLPEKDANQSDWLYFLKVNSWRLGHGIPDEIFIKDGPDKPQYISFHNPFLISLLGSIIQKCSNKLHIEEMLPRTSQLFTINGKRSVTEFLGQWHITTKSGSDSLKLQEH